MFINGEIYVYKWRDLRLYAQAIMSKKITHNK